MVYVINACLRGNLLGVADEARSSRGIVGVVGCLRRDDDSAALGFECVDSVGHVFEERVDNGSVGTLNNKLAPHQRSG